MGFSAKRPANTQPAEQETNPLATLFSEYLSFGAPILPIDGDPGVTTLPPTPSLTEEDEAPWVTDTPSTKVTPAASTKEAQGANSKWIAWQGGSVTVALPNGADIRSIFFQDGISSEVTISAGYGGVICERVTGGVCPIPPGASLITLTMTQTTETQYVFFSADVLPPFNLGGGAGSGNVIYILPQPNAPGENQYYTNESSSLQLVEVGGIIAQAYIDDVAIGQGQPATYSLEPGQTIRFVWGYDTIVSSITSLLDYWPMNDVPNAAPYSTTEGEPGYVLFANSTTRDGLPLIGIASNTMGGPPYGTTPSQRTGVSITSDEATSGYINSLVAETGAATGLPTGCQTGYDYSGWPVTPDGSFSCCFWLMIPMATAGIENTNSGTSPLVHPVLTVNSRSPSFRGADPSYTNGFSIWVRYNTTSSPAIYVALQDSGKTSPPAGLSSYGAGGVNSGQSWITAPALNDFTSSAFPFDTPVFVALTYNSSSGAIKIQLNNQVASSGDTLAITPVFDGQCIAVGTCGLSNDDTGFVGYMAKLALFDGVLGESTIQTLYEAGTQGPNPVFQFFKVE